MLDTEVLDTEVLDTEVLDPEVDELDDEVDVSVYERKKNTVL